MEYDPQTMDSIEMTNRLELFETEFFALAKVMDVFASNIDTITEELDKRLDTLVRGMEHDTPPANAH